MSSSEHQGHSCRDVRELFCASKHVHARRYTKRRYMHIARTCTCKLAGAHCMEAGAGGMTNVGTW